MIDIQVDLYIYGSTVFEPNWRREEKWIHCLIYDEYKMTYNTYVGPEVFREMLLKGMELHQKDVCDETFTVGYEKQLGCEHVWMKPFTNFCGGA